MITLDSTGTALDALFTHRYAQPFLDTDRAPEDEILFCRKISSTWYTRDVTDLFMAMVPISEVMGDQYGKMKGIQVEMIFSVVPITVLASNYTSGTTLTVKERIVDFTLAANDWIYIRDYDNRIEYRRVSSMTATTIVVTEALDTTHLANETEIGFVFAIEPTKNRLDDLDIGVGTMKVKTGFVDHSQKFTIFQGAIEKFDVNPNSVTLRCSDVVQGIVDTKLTSDLEFDDRGIASHPTASGWNGEGTPNVGNGEITPVRYLPEKFPDLLTTETWTFTYDTDETYRDGASGAFVVSGSVYGVLDASLVQTRDVADETITDWLPQSDDVNQRVWRIDATVEAGWSLEIREGDIAFAAGDNFKMFTSASGSPVASKGRAYSLTPLSSLSDLSPTYVADYLVSVLLGLTHENPETGASTDLIPASNLTDVRANGQEYFPQCRGRFNEGESAAKVLDETGLVSLGWWASTPDDHLKFYLYSPFVGFTPTDMSLIADRNHADRVRNLMNIEVSGIETNPIANRVVFEYNTADETREVSVSDSDSEAAFGSREILIRGEDFNDTRLSTVFHIAKGDLTADADRILFRSKLPIKTYTMSGSPQLMRLEVGDTPLLFSRDLGFVNQRLWIIGIEKDLTTRQVTITAEFAKHLGIKTFIWQDTPAETASTIWNSTGFIGTEGDELEGYWADETIQLDGLGDNDASYDARLGIPDPRGQYVEDAFKWW